jgi:hypothetical protein
VVAKATEACADYPRGDMSMELGVILRPDRWISDSSDQ